MLGLLINVIDAFVRLSVRLSMLLVKASMVIVREFLKRAPRSRARVGAAVLAVTVVVGSAQLVDSGPSVKPAVTSTPAANVDVVRPTTPEPLSVIAVVDAATMTLSDGRTIRVGGVIVPPLGTCAGDRAFAFVREQFLTWSRSMITPFGTTDEYGHLWVEITFVDSSSGPLSSQLAQQGYAVAYNQGATADTLAAVSRLSAVARRSGMGQWGPGCAPSPVELAAGPGSATSSPSVTIPDGDDYCDTCRYVHVPRPRVSRPHLPGLHLPHFHRHR